MMLANDLSSESHLLLVVMVRIMILLVPGITFCSTYGSHEEIPNYHTNKLNQDLDKAQDPIVKPIKDVFFTIYANKVVFIPICSYVIKSFIAINYEVLTKSDPLIGSKAYYSTLQSSLSHIDKLFIYKGLIGKLMDDYSN